MTAQRILLIVADGLADRPVKALGGKTPLQAAAKPYLDRLAAQGITGQLDIIAPGVTPGSDTAHLALFGYDPYRSYNGRGPYEAAGVGLVCERADVAFRCNFATVDEQLHVIDRRAGRIREGTEALAKAIDGLRLDGFQVLFRAGTEHRGALVLRGPGLDSRVSDADPHAEGPIHEARALAPEAQRTAELVNRFVRESHRLLNDHPVNMERRTRGELPANILLPRGAGSISALEPLPARLGLRCAGIAGVTLIKGICRMVGLDVPEVAGATGGLDSDFMAKGKAAVAALADHEFVFLNIKAGDVAGHDGKPETKVEVIERLDMMLGYLTKNAPEDLIMALTADHTTPCSVRDHTADPVPVVVAGPGVRPDTVKRFDEIACAQGGLGRLRGCELLPVLLGQANRAAKYGA